MTVYLCLLSYIRAHTHRHKIDTDGYYTQGSHIGAILQSRIPLPGRCRFRFLFFRCLSALISQSLSPRPCNAATRQTPLDSMFANSRMHTSTELWITHQTCAVPGVRIGCIVYIHIMGKNGRLQDNVWGPCGMLSWKGQDVVLSLSRQHTTGPQPLTCSSPPVFRKLYKKLTKTRPTPWRSDDGQLRNTLANNVADFRCNAAQCAICSRDRTNTPDTCDRSHRQNNATNRSTDRSTDRPWLCCLTSDRNTLVCFSYFFFTVAPNKYLFHRYVSAHMTPKE